MQIVRPIDIEDALHIDLGEHAADYMVCAPPAPDDLTAGVVCVTSVGGAPLTEVCSEHDVSIDCWADTEAEAIAAANFVAGVVASLPMRTFESGRCYVTARVDMPYLNPDPYRPNLPRATFRASVGIRGLPVFAEV